MQVSAGPTCCRHGSRKVSALTGQSEDEVFTLAFDCLPDVRTWSGPPCHQPVPRPAMRTGWHSLRGHSLTHLCISIAGPDFFLGDLRHVRMLRGATVPPHHQGSLSSRDCPQFQEFLSYTSASSFLQALSHHMDRHNRNTTDANTSSSCSQESS